MALKKLPGNFLQKCKAGSKIGFNAFVLTFGIVGTVVTLISGTGTTISVQFVLSLVFFSALIGILTAFFKGKTSLLPDEFVDEFGHDGKYLCDFCTTPSLKEACELTKPYYGQSFVSPEVAEQWRIKTPQGFVHIFNSNGELCASFGVLGLRDSFNEQFKEGKVTDGQISSSDILSFPDCQKAKILYISGVVVKEPGNYLGCKRARVMLWAMLRYLKECYGLKKKREIIAVAANPAAEKLMKNLNFHLVSEASNRRDLCNMYSFELCSSSWQGLLNEVGDFHRMVDWKCSLNEIKEMKHEK